MSRKIKKAFWEWLHQIYIILALIAFIIGALNVEHTIRENIFIATILSYLFVLSIFTGFFIYTHGYKSRYAEATYMFHDASHHARDAYNYLSWCLDDHLHTKFDQKHFIDKLSHSLTAMSESFTLVTGAKCRVCIKIIMEIEKDINDPKNWYLKTISRDQTSLIECANNDLNEGKEHTISENTEYMSLFDCDNKIFICNDLSKRPGYRNSKLPKDWPDRNYWPIEYISRLVSPIRYAYHPTDNPEGIDLSERSLNRDLFGFLVIDSATRGIFDKRYCPELSCAYADIMFPVIKTYRKVLEKEINRSKNKIECS